MSPFWSPRVPSALAFTRQLFRPESRRDVSSNCLYMDFGGPDGSRLSLLNRITPYLDDGGSLRGMAFFYDDGTELVFGSRRAYVHTTRNTRSIEPSIIIYGSAGERIIRVGLVDNDDNETRYGKRFQVWCLLAF
jgi:hypothetical protein